VSVFIDTNVAVYAMCPEEPAKQAMAQSLIARHLDRGLLVVSTQVLQETFSVLTREKRVVDHEALRFVRLLGRRRVIPADADSVLNALELSVAEQLSVWDALIVHAAMQAGCTTLLTEDLQSGRRFGDVEVVNPFVTAVHEPPPLFKVPVRKKRARTAR
jgi:predicted nucleic acid-binding protein